MKFIRTTLFSAVITFIRIAAGFISGKVIALYTGPTGVALIGAFTNFISIALTFANGAITNGVVKYTAEYENDLPRLKSLFSTSLRISLYCSAVIGITLLLLAPYCSKWIFSISLYTNAIRALGLTIVLYSLNSLLISILNGLRQIKIYTIVNTAGSIIGLIFTCILAFFYKIQGALYALVLVQSIVFFVTVAIVLNSHWFSWAYFNESVNKEMLKKLANFSLMSIVSILTVPVSQIILRNMLIQNFNSDAAGLWQGMMRISDGYLMIITTSLSTYYLPKLSSLKTNNELRKEILGGYKIILPSVMIGCIVIYLLRFFIIKILYTSAFLEMERLFLWQLLGDFFKIASWVLAYMMVAKAMTKLFVITEILFSLSYVVLGYLLVRYYGLEGISVAFAINYLIYLVVMIIIFRNLMFKSNG